MEKEQLVWGVFAIIFIAHSVNQVRSDKNMAGVEWYRPIGSYLAFFVLGVCLAMFLAPYYYQLFDK